MPEFATPFAWPAVSLLAYLACWAVRFLPVRDAPDGARKTQVRPVPATGGIAIFATVAIAWWVLFTDEVPRPLSLPALALVVGAVIIGVADDIFGLPAKLKTGVIGLLVLGVSASGLAVDQLPLPGLVLDHPALMVAGSALFLFVIINMVNFMDGANGLAVGSASVLILVLSGPAGALSLASLVFFASIGFLVHNLRGALYAGDAGALGLGALLGALAIEASVMATGLTVWLAALVCLPFLVDPLLTQLWRARRRQSLFQAHTDHAYQRLIRRLGWSHRRVALLWFGLSVVSGALGLALMGQTTTVQIGAYTASVAVGTGLWLRVPRTL